MKRTRMHRRTWLRSSAGAMLPLPFLNLMAPLAARESTTSKTASALRGVIQAQRCASAKLEYQRWQRIRLSLVASDETI